MPLYLFEKEDGERFEMLFTISEVPDKIECEDGQIAYRTFGVPYLPGSSNSRIKKEQIQKNIDAGNRGRSYWKKQFEGK